ncbi:hypothetical protein [Streptomyces osmaniensis]|uniref:Secreted protein n=1 Tax=Streptomyces osmaniensis TaxID=593134 RepID=A0ABP6ZAE1_9ACTN
MKTFITRSATLAACATLLLAGAAVQASADGTHGTDQPAAPDMVVINKASKTTTIHNNVVGNNNNAAGNDLAVGNNNVLGTGHTVSQAPTSATSGSPLQFGLTNATNLPLHVDYVQNGDNCPWINPPVGQILQPGKSFVLNMTNDLSAGIHCASFVVLSPTPNPNNLRISIAFAQDSFAGDMSATAPGSVGLISTPGFLDSNDVFQVTINCDSDAIAEGLCKPNS